MSTTRAQQALDNLSGSAGGPAEVAVAGMGQSKEHSLEGQLKVAAALGSTQAGPLAGIRRTRLRVGSPTGLQLGSREARA